MKNGFTEFFLAIMELFRCPKVMDEDKPDEETANDVRDGNDK